MRVDLRRFRVWIIAAGLIVALAVAIVPQLLQIKRIKHEVTGLEQRLDASHAINEGLSQLARDVTALKQEVAAIDRVIPDQTAQADLIREIGLHIETEHLGDQVLQTRDVRTDEDLARLPVEINFTGDSIAAFRFVRRIEQMPHLVHVNLLRVESAPSEDGLVKVMMNVDAFFAASGGPS